MAEEKDDAVEGGEGKPVKKKGKTMMLIIIVVVVLLAGGGGAFFFMKKGAKPAGEGGEAGGEQKTEAGKKADEGVMFPVEPFVVNLNDQAGNRFLKVSLQLELSNPVLLEKGKAKGPQIRDAIITLLTSKTSEALMSPEGKLQLKDEINIRVNQILGENSVKNVYLTDFVMQ